MSIKSGLVKAALICFVMSFNLPPILFAQLAAQDFQSHSWQNKKIEIGHNLDKPHNKTHLLLHKASLLAYHSPLTAEKGNSFVKKLDLELDCDRSSARSIECSALNYFGNDITELWFVNFVGGLRDSQALIARVKTGKTKHITIVSFRGSESVKDWINNLRVSSSQLESEANGTIKIDTKKYSQRFALPRLTLGAGRALVHEGFYNGSKTVFHDYLMPVLSNIVGEEDDLYFTGHSLGGAFSILLATHLTTEESFYEGRSTMLLSRLKQVVTFGAPKIGNINFSLWYNWEADLYKKTIRYENDWDIVPKLLSSFIGYFTAGRLIDPAVSGFDDFDLDLHFLKKIIRDLGGINKDAEFYPILSETIEQYSQKGAKKNMIREKFRNIGVIEELRRLTSRSVVPICAHSLKETLSNKLCSEDETVQALLKNRDNNYSAYSNRWP